MLLKESQEGVYLERRYPESLLFGKTERTTVLLKKPAVEQQISWEVSGEAPFPESFEEWMNFLNGQAQQESGPHVSRKRGTQCPSPAADDQNEPRSLFPKELHTFVCVSVPKTLNVQRTG